MDTNRLNRLMDLFERALELPREEWEAFAGRESGEDTALRQDLYSLLQAQESAGEYFRGLADGIVAPAYDPIIRATQRAREAGLQPALQAALGGRYRILEGLGGGMSRVFLAEEVSLGRKVVIKVLPPEMIASADRFRREIRLLAEMQHPNIVPLLTSDSSASFLYYTMPFIRGESLRARLTRDGSLPVNDALSIWRDVLDALSYAHARGVIHRDIKPANILLGERNAVVTDFGIAHAIEVAGGDVGDPTPGLILGTPAYAAPEQLAGDGKTDQRADIYSAALVMYLMLEGRLPHSGDTTAAMIRARLTSVPDNLTREDCAPEVAALVMRCLARAPDERPASANEVLSALAAPVPSVWLRHRAGRFATAAVLVAAVGMGGWGLLKGEPAPVARQLTQSVDAWEWYQRGTDVTLMRSPAGRLQARQYLERSIAADSNFAAAWAQLVHIRLFERGSEAGAERALLAEAGDMARKAVALAPELADAHVALGWVQMLNWEWTEAEESLKHATALDPRVRRGFEGLARLYQWTLRPAEQLVAARRGLGVDPLSHSALREYALALGAHGMCDEAITQMQRLKTLSPPAGVAGVILGQCYAAKEMWAEAIAEFEWAMSFDARTALAFYGFALARGGRQADARTILGDLLSGERYSHGAFGLATVYTGLRDYDRAFEWLARSIGEKTIRHHVMGPMFTDLRRDPRFAEMKRQLGL